MCIRDRFIGIRIKPFNEELRARSFRTLDIFISTLVERNQGQLPENFVVTLPKITIPEQVSTLVALLAQLEKHLSLDGGSLKFEMMIETTQSILSLIHISEPTRLLSISYAVFCL